jgi:hypothetical protein
MALMLMMFSLKLRHPYTAPKIGIVTSDVSALPYIVTSCETSRLAMSCTLARSQTFLQSVPPYSA